MEKGNVNREEFSYEANMQLVVLAQGGDEKAMNQIIEVNLPLVTSICKRFSNRGYEYEDIYQIGCIGLVKAVNNFDSKYGVKFSTYAVPMIIGEIKRFLRDDGIIKISRSIKGTAKKLHFAKEELTFKLNREPTIDELSEYSGIAKDDILIAMESLNSLQYLYDTIHQEDGAPVLLIDKISEKLDDNVDILDQIALKEALSSLDENSRKIIMLRYFKDKTQVQVAKMLGISQVQVSRIEKRVLKIMREKLE
ncbi:RNA polymerase sporulation sigma factor SigF [Clostridium sp. HCP1S3_B4]|uniref:RNA polymerase sporulation sigma factor SigF n=1 Tax=unclassified Clostridium TaxID=2614128 RepID=UPI0016AAD01A|nr:RNA polymerase sporulation sigma factor SigF [Clostridiales bacterium]NLK24887.1 RNA polymerase sporulation sigma factor SigF [Clostridiales bacterium]